jgi:DNA-directed RNA polymerase specialized sigma24 family protein
VDTFYRWLHAVAYRMTGVDDPNHDDLVQEGAHAMWRAEATHDPAKGAKASWLVRAAEMRMRDLAFGHGRYTGHVPVRGVKQGPEPVPLESVSQYEEHWIEEVNEALDLAYHRGEIAAAVDDLPDVQRRAARNRMYDLPSTASERDAWKRVQPKLQARLAHLRGCW